jgi:uncharacterized protein YkwD
MTHGTAAGKPAKTGVRALIGAPVILRRHPLAVLLLAAAFLVAGGAPADARAAERMQQPVVTASDVAQRIHKLVNDERARHGLSTLAWDKALAGIAANHSRDMLRRDTLTHDGPEGQNFGDRYRQAGYSCQIRIGNVIHTGAENVALVRLYNRATTRDGVQHYDWNSPREIARQTVDGWMRSRGHRENILTPHWRRQGISIEIAPDNKVYVTQNFC